MKKKNKSHKIRNTLLFLVLLTAGTGIFLWLWVRCRMGELPGAETFSVLPNFKNGSFQNLEPVRLDRKKIAKKKGLWRFLLSSPNKPKTPPAVQQLFARSFSERPEDFSVCWLGHSTLIFELGGRRILTDPVFGNAAPVPGVVRRYIPPVLSREELPPVDIVLVSHDHYDHLEYETIRALRANKAHFVTSMGVGARLRGWGIEAERITELNWGQSRVIDGITVNCHPARHFSGRSLKDRNRTLWSSFSFQHGAKKIFFGADSGYGKHFREIGKKYGPFDLVCLEIDAWNENWPDNHSFPLQVIQEFRELRGGLLLPIHWGVFDLAGHPYYESIGHIANLARLYRIPLLRVEQGQRFRMRAR